MNDTNIKSHEDKKMILDKVSRNATRERIKKKYLFFKGLKRKDYRYCANISEDMRMIKISTIKDHLIRICKIRNITTIRDFLNYIYNN